MNQLHKYQVRKLYYKLVNLNISLQKADVYQILEHLTKIEYSKLSESFDTFVEIDEKELQSITVQVEQDVPVSYILKYKYFYKRKYYVDRRVLIPRSDTEIIVETSLKWIREQSGILIGDICTGSGIIGIALNIETNSQVICTDISAEALTVAKLNSETLNTNRLSFIQGNLVDPFIENGIKLNFLVANPPYIDFNDIDVSESVKKYEPHLALFADSNGLKYYQEILDKLNLVMDFTKPFAVVMEFGWKQKSAIDKMLSTANLQISWEFIKDYSGNWRCVIITNR